MSGYSTGTLQLVRSMDLRALLGSSSKSMQ
jgi:hypothetical protein